MTKGAKGLRRIGIVEQFNCAKLVSAWQIFIGADRVSACAARRPCIRRCRRR
jgi:hypothetical protein